MIKLLSMNGGIMLRVVDDNESIYLSMISVMNLINNIDKTIVVKDVIKEGNDRDYTPRPQTLGKLSKDNSLKVAVGKGFAEIKSSKDLDHEYVFEGLVELKTFAEIFESDFENAEEYKRLNNLHSRKSKADVKASIEI